VRVRNIAEVGLLLEAVVLLAVARAGLRALSFATLRQALDGCARVHSRRSRAAPLRIAWAVEAVSRRLPGPPTCLTQALAADVMLRRRGYRAELFFGLRKTSAAHAPDGHAWVTCEGDVVVGDVANLSDYSACLISCPRG
jgi:hypothetical protein